MSDLAQVESPPASEQELTSLLAEAASLVEVRPIGPYPGWHFDIDWDHPATAFQRRREIWSYFAARKLPGPLVIEWYDRLRLKLYLGNDISKQVFIAGCMDPNEFAFLDRVLAPGMTFVDAGANDGIYSLFASVRVRPSGQVWAFEPSRREFARLRENLVLNRLHNVRGFPMALLDFNGRGKLSIAGYGHEGQNTMGTFIYEGVELLRREMIRVRRLDDIVAERQATRVDFIKMDVEGSEFRLLEGARRTLREMRPILLLELCEAALRRQGNGAADLRGLLGSLDYRLYTFDPRSGLPRKATARAVSQNVVAVPAERPLPGV